MKYIHTVNIQTYARTGRSVPKHIQADIHDTYIHKYGKHVNMQAYIHTKTSIQAPNHTFINTNMHTHGHTYIQTDIKAGIHTQRHTYNTQNTQGTHTYTQTAIHTYKQRIIQGDAYIHTPISYIHTQHAYAQTDTQAYIQQKHTTGHTIRHTHIHTYRNTYIQCDTYTPTYGHTT